jgi:hypothetical protein
VWAVVGGATLFLLHRTTFRPLVYAVGNRERAAYLSGIATRRVTLLCFVIAGACSAAAGVLLTGYSTKAYQAMGDAYQLPAIAAVVLGGTHILGGRGSYLGTVVGVVLITLLQSILSVMQIPEMGRQVAYGLVIIAMLLVYGRGRRHASEKKKGRWTMAIDSRTASKCSTSASASSCFGNVHLERLYTGCRWAEGPAWFAGGRYLVWSDIPNDRMLRWDETDGSVSVFRQPAMNTNGHTVDREGRLVSCEHRGRCVSRTEHDGTRTCWPRMSKASASTHRTTWW